MLNGFKLYFFSDILIFYKHKNKFVFIWSKLRYFKCVLTGTGQWQTVMLKEQIWWLVSDVVLCEQVVNVTQKLYKINRN